MKLALVAVLATCCVLPLDANANPFRKLYAGLGYQYSSTNSTASTDTPPARQFPPESIPMDNLPFDDDANGWSAAIGYQFVEFFAVELGYEDLGEVRSSLSVLPSQSAEGPYLGVESVFLKAQFQYPLGNRFAATWHLGVTRTEFEADGALTLSLGIPFPRFPPPESVVIPFADPDRETGYFVGFGASWRAHKHLEVELSYSRKKLEVLEFDSVGIRLIGRL